MKVFLRSTLIAFLMLSAEAVPSNERPAKQIDLSTFPGPHNTGVPKGTILTPYDGPCNITSPDTVIFARAVKCVLRVNAPGLRIIRSTTSWIHVDTPGASVIIEDSLVDAGQWYGPAISPSDVTIRRGDIRGGQTSVQCSTNCLIEDSWLHGQYIQPRQPQHLGGFLSNGGYDVTLRHNTIGCDVTPNEIGGGCTGDAQIYSDFGPLTRFTFERNLFLATFGGFCTAFGYSAKKPYGINPTFIVVADNTWERGARGKCGIYGPTTSFPWDGKGNLWQGNVWDDGSALDD
ncbi:hypothetical protein QO004_001726 [Rhizobium mesoamericanum]|uniref:hypothetical protein n=1 Tax=Rhizobium mesoamericanum TaxID=1079800 RepID=UPI002781E801|nr:hypothetical protein [Rhizobium mesoamericanum]MDQ0559944.1 hypothetical protein [Rhizobium mesoamericanum]